VDDDEPVPKVRQMMNEAGIYRLSVKLRQRLRRKKPSSIILKTYIAVFKAY
jgi:hypothetical protein